MVLPGVSNVQSPCFPAKQAGYFPRAVVAAHRPWLEGVPTQISRLPPKFTGQDSERGEFAVAQTQGRLF